VFLFRTERNAPRGRIVSIDTRKPGVLNWKQIVPESSNTMVSASLVNNQLIVDYLSDAHSLVKVFDLKGKALHDIELPASARPVASAASARIARPSTRTPASPRRPPSTATT
jgi:protease II